MKQNSIENSRTGKNKPKREYKKGDIILDSAEQNVKNIYEEEAPVEATEPKEKKVKKEPVVENTDKTTEQQEQPVAETKPEDFDNDAEEKTKFTPVPYEKPKRKKKEAVTLDNESLKNLKQKVRTLNEQYLSAKQREDKALLYSQLEQAQKEYRKMEEDMDTRPKLSEEESKMARLEALREIIADLNERYLREPQREQKAILYSQLEQAQKEYRKLEQELDEASSKKNKKEGAETDETSPDKENPDSPAPDKSETEDKKDNHGEEKAGDEPKPPHGHNEELGSLDELRDQYLNAKRKRGNVFRGSIMGRLFRRTLDFRGRNLDMGGDQGRQDLELIRNEYQEILRRHRETELRNLETTLNANTALTPEQRNAAMSTRMIELMAEEQAHIDIRSVEGIERNRFERMKTQFRQRVLTRGAVGMGLLGVASLTAGTGVAAAAIGTRAIMGGAGTYVGTEAALERYSSLIGHKNGLVRRMRTELARRNYSVTGHDRDMYVASIPADEIREEAARLRMLQVEKGVALHNLHTLGDDGTLAAMIIARDNQITAQEVLERANIDRTTNPNERWADLLSQRLGRELNCRNELVEREVDRERLKKMARKTIAVIAGGAVGWIIGGKLFTKDTPTAKITGSTKIPETTSTEIPKPIIGEGIKPIIAPDMHTVVPGENTWKIIEAKLNAQHAMDGLTKGADTHIIDTFKDKLANLDVTELKKLGFSSGDINLIKPGDMLDMTSLSNTKAILEAFSNAQKLSPTEVTSILHNNAKIFGWLLAHKQELTAPLNSGMIDQILKGLI